jgi:thiol-disulfide isomerase/thioredoxin
MKKLFLLTKAIFAILFCQAQADSSKLYLQFPDVPPFSITKVPDSSNFSKQDLKKKKPTIIMLFSPDCDHCMQQTKELQNKYELIKNVQIVMVSFLNYNLVKKFYDDYNMVNYPSINIGRDGKYFLGTFYKPHIFPSIFLYNRKGKFVKFFEGNVSAKQLAESL